MRFKHIGTGCEITGETIRELLGKGADVFNFHDPSYRPRPFNSVQYADPLDREPYYTYRLKDIPFHKDWVEVPDGADLTAKEMEHIMWFLRFNAPQEDEHISTAVEKLHRAFCRLNELKDSRKILA